MKRPWICFFCLLCALSLTAAQIDYTHAESAQEQPALELIVERTEVSAGETVNVSYRKIDTAITMLYAACDLRCLTDTSTIFGGDTFELDDALTGMVSYIPKFDGKLYVDIHYRDQAGKEHIQRTGEITVKPALKILCTVTGVHDGQVKAGEQITVEYSIEGLPNKEVELSYDIETDAVVEQNTLPGRHGSISYVVSNSKSDFISFDLSAKALGEQGIYAYFSTRYAIVAGCMHTNTKEETVIAQATCTKKGEKQSVCVDCGAIVKAEIPALGHDWDEGVIAKVATPTASGVKTFTCKRCNDARTESFEFVPSDTPRYSITDITFDKDEMTVTGKMEHDAATVSSDKLFARVSFFMSDGSFAVLATVVDDGEFEAICSGDVVHIAVQATDSAKVKPGTYQAFGGNEIDVE